MKNTVYRQQIGPPDVDFEDDDEAQEAYGDLEELLDYALRDAPSGEQP